jgi:hypothetical protein
MSENEETVTRERTEGCEPVGRKRGSVTLRCISPLRTGN